MSTISLIALIALQAAPTLSGDIRETYGDYVRVSGGVLVGLELEGPAGNALVDVTGLTLVTPAGELKVCFDAASHDGFYSATGDLDVVNDSARAVLIAKKEQWKLSDKAARYTDDGFAARAALGPDCRLQRAAPLLPVRAAGNQELSVLVASINSQRAVNVSAVIEDGSGAIHPGSCHALGRESARTFDTVCKFELASIAPGPIEVIVRRLPRSGPTREEAFSAYLPPSYVRTNAQ